MLSYQNLLGHLGHKGQPRQAWIVVVPHQDLQSGTNGTESPLNIDSFSIDRHYFCLFLMLKKIDFFNMRGRIC